MTADLFSPQGVLAVSRLAAASSVLAFDLDGTLAPLVPLPDDAKVAACTSARLQALSRLWPVAVITGRAADDATERLGFVPRYLFGNHGAEPAGSTRPHRLVRALDPCREFLRRKEAPLQARCIEVEDKGMSLALHYRRATDPRAAREWLDALTSSLGGGVRASHGHAVLNLCPADAPDKGDALMQVMRDCGAARALVMGDDDNDEPAFAKAPPGSVSVRIGPNHTSTKAGFRLRHQSQVDSLLCTLLDLRS